MSRGRWAKPTAAHAVLGLGLIVMLGPIYWMVASSLKSPGEIAAWPPTLWPRHIELGNYAEVWRTGSFRQYFLNSVIVAAASVFGNVLFGSMAGYAFSRLRFPGRDILFLLVLATMLVPGAVVVVPLLGIMKWLPGGGQAGWLNTYHGLIAPTAISAFSIFFFRQYLLGIPMDLDEAARLDGCSTWQVYWRVILPMCGPAVTLVTVFTFLNVWNDYFWPLVCAREPSMFTIQVALRYFQTERGVQWHLLMAGSVIALAPVVALYFALQPFFEKGLGALGTGTKG